MKREDILAVYEAGPDAVVALVAQLLAAHQAQVAELTTRIKRLEAQIGKDSHNSHKSPSRVAFAASLAPKASAAFAAIGPPCASKVTMP